MQVIDPITITDAMLISSSAPETDYSVWNSFTGYGLGDMVINTTTHRIYKSLAGSNTNHDPTLEGPVPIWWKDYAPTNRWAMFDNEVNTQTALASSLAVTVAPGMANSLALLELVGNSVAVSMLDTAGGTVVYTATIPLETSVVFDWYTYFFEPFSKRTSVVLTNLPPYTAGRVTVTLTGGGTVKCGHMVLGNVYGLGATQYGVTAGIRDYSRKVTDAETGVVSLEKRHFAKRMRAQLILDAGSVNLVASVLEGLRATPAVWIGVESGGYEPLLIFGFYISFELSVQYPTRSFYTIEIEGMI